MMGTRTREFKWMFTLAPNLVAVENLPLHTNMQALVVTLNSLELQVDSLNSAQEKMLLTM